MRIPFIEPRSSRYIYVDEKTNLVYVMMPTMTSSGSTQLGETATGLTTEIGLDNTCKAVYALQEFFGKSTKPRQLTIQHVLRIHQKSLEFDINLINTLSPDQMILKQQKQARLEQINEYIALVQQIQESEILDVLEDDFPNYPKPLKRLLRDNTNFFAMVLRPRVPDLYLRSVNPVFSVGHPFLNEHDDIKTVDSLFVNTLEDSYKALTIVCQDTKTRITREIAASTEGTTADFKEIQRILSEKTKAIFNMDIDFTKTTTDEAITQDFIDDEMGFERESTTNTEYIDALFYYAAPTLFDSTLEPPFYTAKTPEDLSILTQFFLAEVNIYCYANELSRANFGTVLDASEELSNAVATGVCSAVSNDINIEECLFAFVNQHQNDLQLNRELNHEDRAIINKNVMMHYTAIKGADHKDEFQVFDSSKPGLFVSHQNNICANFCDFIMQVTTIDLSDFIHIRSSASCKQLHGVLPHNNKWITDGFELNMDAINSKQLASLFELLTKDSQRSIIKNHPKQIAALFAKSTPEGQQAINQLYPDIMHYVQLLVSLSDFLHCVANGQRNQAESILQQSKDIQDLLTAEGTFTDSSGRLFECTAYEYAYWAKDTYTRRMLEGYMGDETKATLLKNINAMERIDTGTGKKIGLPYQQECHMHRSANFSFKPIINAMQEYIDTYDLVFGKKIAIRQPANFLKRALMDVGLEQRNIPFSAAQLIYGSPEQPENVTFYNPLNKTENALYPIPEKLGHDFALVHGNATVWDDKPSQAVRGVAAKMAYKSGIQNDLKAMQAFDKESDDALLLSREFLSRPTPQLGITLS